MAYVFFKKSFIFFNWILLRYTRSLTVYCTVFRVLLADREPCCDIYSLQDCYSSVSSIGWGQDKMYVILQYSAVQKELNSLWQFNYPTEHAAEDLHTLIFPCWSVWGNIGPSTAGIWLLAVTTVYTVNYHSKNVLWRSFILQTENNCLLDWKLKACMYVKKSSRDFICSSDFLAG